MTHSGIVIDILRNEINTKVQAQRNGYIKEGGQS